jgi:hypothetical protein
MALALLLTVVASVGSPTPGGLPRGNDLFRLGMTRAEVDSVVAGRALTIISDGTAFLVTGSDDTTVEYEQYSFFLPPHGTELLWKVTIGYRVEATRQDLDRVRVELEEQLGPPAGDSDRATPPEANGDQPRSDRQLMWADASTQVRLGGRWTAEPDKNADRMLVTWTDRRIQKLIEARRKKDKAPSSP